PTVGGGGTLRARRGGGCARRGGGMRRRGGGEARQARRGRHRNGGCERRRGGCRHHGRRGGGSGGRRALAFAELTAGGRWRERLVGLRHDFGSPSWRGNAVRAITLSSRSQRGLGYRATRRC